MGNEVGLSEELCREIEGLLSDGRKIEAIKAYREQTGVGLKEAKMTVEAMARDLSAADGSSAKPIGPSGCGTAIALAVVVGGLLAASGL